MSLVSCFHEVIFLESMSLVSCFHEVIRKHVFCIMFS